MMVHTFYSIHVNFYSYHRTKDLVERMQHSSRRLGISMVFCDGRSLNYYRQRSIDIKLLDAQWTEIQTN